MHNLKISVTKLSEFLDLFYKLFRNFDFQRQKMAFLRKQRCKKIAGMVVHPVTQVIGEQTLVAILDLSEVAWTCWGCFYTQQWAGAEDGEGIRPAAGTGNE